MSTYEIFETSNAVAKIAFRKEGNNKYEICFNEDNTYWDPGSQHLRKQDMLEVSELFRVLAERMEG